MIARTTKTTAKTTAKTPAAKATTTKAKATTPIAVEPETPVIEPEPTPIAVTEAPVERLQDQPVEKEIEINSVNFAADNSGRETTSQKVIEDYASLMEQGLWDWDRKPLPRVFWDGKLYHISDGWHRIKAALTAKYITILCEVLNGTERDARFDALAQNKYHGLQRSTADKRKAAKVMLLDPEWSQMSDRSIAKHIGVSAPFVGDIRAQLAVGAPELATQTRTDAKGRTIDTSGIGRKRTPKAPAPPATPPQNQTNGTAPTAPATTQQDDRILQDLEKNPLMLGFDVVDRLDEGQRQALARRLKTLLPEIPAKDRALDALNDCDEELTTDILLFVIKVSENLDFKKIALAALSRCSDQDLADIAETM
jgi:hypothetical protein